MSSWLQATGTGVSLRLKIVPRASRTEVVGPHGDALKIRIAAPPVEGAANDELIAFLAKAVGVPRSLVSVVSGQNSKNKTVRIDQIAANTVQERLWRE